MAYLHEETPTGCTTVCLACCRLQFSDGDISTGQVSRLTFILSQYALNGTWLGFTQWTRQLQICGVDKWEGGKWTE
jgi:meckelin